MPRLLLAGLAVLGLGVSGCGSQDETSSPNSSETAVIRVEGFGDIEIRFFPDKANGHVENFKKLARAKFYDGTTFHRVIPGFMIQGGDPLSRDDNPLNDGTGGPDYTIVAEFNDVPHRRGIVSMARGNDPLGAGSCPPGPPCLLLFPPDSCDVSAAGNDTSLENMIPFLF